MGPRIRSAARRIDDRATVPDDHDLQTDLHAGANEVVDQRINRRCEMLLTHCELDGRSRRDSSVIVRRRSRTAALQVATEKRRQRPGTLLRSCSPSSTKISSDPTTRSVTVRDTQTVI